MSFKTVNKMLRITNKKIGFKHYPVFSLHFDNTGEYILVSLGNSENIKKIRCSVNKGSSLKLYAGIKAGLERIGITELQNKYLFFQLPVYSYHVTVWDGLNEGNKGKISSAHKLKLEDFLMGLPFSLTQDYEFLTVANSSLLVKKNCDLIFKFTELSVCNNSVLVAKLEAYNNTSKNTLEQIKKERLEL